MRIRQLLQHYVSGLSATLSCCKLFSNWIPIVSALRSQEYAACLRRLIIYAACVRRLDWGRICGSGDWIKGLCFSVRSLWRDMLWHLVAPLLSRRARNGSIYFLPIG